MNELSPARESHLVNGLPVALRVPKFPAFGKIAIIFGKPFLCNRECGWCRENIGWRGVAWPVTEVIAVALEQWHPGVEPVLKMRERHNRQGQEFPQGLKPP